MKEFYSVLFHDFFFLSLSGSSSGLQMSKGSSSLLPGGSSGLLQGGSSLIPGAGGSSGLLQGGSSLIPGAGGAGGAGLLPTGKHCKISINL